MASQKGLLCMALIVVHRNGFDSFKVGNIESSYCVIGFGESVYLSLS